MQCTMHTAQYALGVIDGDRVEDALPASCTASAQCRRFTCTTVMLCDVYVYDRQPQSWTDGPGAGTFQHTENELEKNTKNQWIQGQKGGANIGSCSHKKRS